MAFLRRPRPVAPPGTFDRLEDVRGSIHELYAGLTGPVVKAFGTLPPLPPDHDPLTGAQRVAATVARHLGIGDARMIVAFSALGAHYRDDPRDIPAVLAHEVTHVFLHRKGIRYPDLVRTEILTDTAALYLGLGRPMLGAYRVEVTQGRYTRRRTTSRVGYLSPPEMGYVLAKRALAFGEPEKPLAGAAGEAYRTGYRRALEDYARPPLSGAGRAARRQYERDKRAGQATAEYRFDGARVVFACPVCHQGTRAPTGRALKVRCAVCRSVFDCET